jgi:MFS family permease
MYLIVLLNVIIHGCMTASRVVASLFAIELGVNAFGIGLIISLYSAAPLLLGVFAGRVTDRYGVQPPMVAGTLLCGSGLLIPFLFTHAGSLYASAAVIGAGFVMYNVAVQNLTGAWGPREDRTKNFSTLSLGYSVSSFFGPLAVGYIIEYSGHARAYLCLSLTTLIALAVLLSYRKIREVQMPPAAKHTGSAFLLLREPELRKVLITGAMVVTGWDLYMFYLPLYGRSINLSPSTIGILLGTFAVATFIVRFSLPRLTARYTARRVLAYSMFLGAAIFLIFPFAQNAWLLGALSFGIGLALGCSQPLTLLMSYNRSPQGRTGEVTGVRLTLNHLTHTAVPVAAGALSAAFGMSPVFVMIASILAVSGYLSETLRGRNQTPPPS